MSTATRTALLVVDDDAHFRETLADAMSLKDAVVDGASSAAEASAKLAAGLPTAVLLDVQLPDVNGVELCRRLKRDPATRAVPVILLSAKFTEPADRAEGLLAGADAYLAKPLNVDALWEEVGFLLGRR